MKNLVFLLRMISPLLAEDMDPVKRSQIRTQIAQTHDISERTLYRLEAEWRKDGFAELRPADRMFTVTGTLTRT